MAFMISVGNLFCSSQFGPHRHDLLDRDLPCEIAYHDLLFRQQVVHYFLRKNEFL